MRHESLCYLKERYGMATIDCKQRAVDTALLAGGDAGDQRPSGVRTPIQLSRTW